MPCTVTLARVASEPVLLTALVRVTAPPVEVSVMVPLPPAVIPVVALPSVMAPLAVTEMSPFAVVRLPRVKPAPAR